MFALEFPDYDINELCGDMLAAQVASGEIKPSETAELMLMCRFGVEMFKPVAFGLWDRADEAARASCMAEAKSKAVEKGVSTVWYGHLVDCLSPPDSGKGDRLPVN